MHSDALPEVSEASTAAVDPCVAARCASQASRDVVLRLGGQDRSVRLCDAHAVRLGRSAPPVLAEA